MPAPGREGGGCTLGRWGAEELLALPEALDALGEELVLAPAFALDDGLP